MSVQKGCSLNTQTNNEQIMGGWMDVGRVFRVQTQHREWRNSFGVQEGFTWEVMSKLEFEGLDELCPKELSEMMEML